MSRLLIPNTCQVPNVLLDEVMPRLAASALKVLLAIVRKTYGFQKQSDRISFSQLQTLTGLSREGVNQGIKALRPLLKIKPGHKGQIANEYSLNLDVATGLLVNKSDQSSNLTSQNNGKRLVRKVDSPKPSIQNQDRGPKTPSPKSKDSRVKEFFTWWDAEYQKRFGEPYVFNGGKDGKLCKNLLCRFDLQKLTSLALRFLNSEDPWVQQSGGYTIGVFASQINKLVSTSKTYQPRRKEMTV